MSKEINIRLNSNDINGAISEIEKFKQEITSKLERFVSELADVGIEVAKQNIFVEEDGNMIDRSNLVTFTKELDANATGATCIIIATPTPYITQWKKSKEGKDVITASVNPLLMAEFGSGAYAIDGHRGTFPGQKNAFKDHWVWYDVQGVKHYSSGNTPTRPLFKAKLEMEQQIANIAMIVFGASV